MVQLFENRTAVDIYGPLGKTAQISRWARGLPTAGLGGERMESNQRYYRRRAVEERLAAQRAISEQARAWHAKLAEDFARRAEVCTSAAVTA
jgi:hypothetical protein